ncbi:MAG TPA: AI-2E family transporter [Longimicrobiales bacterium]|nr:AI-2E family transporter [Longimicrobiales bacterium]
MAESERRDPDGPNGTTARRLERGFLLVVVLGISILFLVMIRRFLVAVILAGVFAAMSRPVYLALTEKLGGRPRTAALLTVLGMLLLILLPLSGFLALVVTEAIEVTQMAGPWIREQSGRWDELTIWLENLPLVGEVLPDRETLLARAAETVAGLGSFLIDQLRAATTGTLFFVLQLFVTLYATYFFLSDGPTILARILYYSPLDESDERKLVGQFVSVTRATIKGSILVGLIQGALAGAAFFVLGIPAAAFWSTVMAVLSVIPMAGSGIVWAPTAVILVSTGRPAAGIGLALWGLLVVGTIDNFLRPRLVGRDTKMHDVLVLLSTFGGLFMFGPVGFIVGPMIAALFITAWGLYGAAFREILPGRPSVPSKTAAGAAPAREVRETQAEAEPEDAGEPASPPLRSAQP